MPKTPKTPTAIDWRKLPRKPAASRRSQQIAIRVTPSEHAAITAAAKAAELTLRDYMVGRCIEQPGGRLQ